MKIFASLGEGLHAVQTLAIVRLLRLSSWLLRKGLQLYRAGHIAPVDLKIIWHLARNLGRLAWLLKGIKASRPRRRSSNNEVRDGHSD